MTDPNPTPNRRDELQWPIRISLLFLLSFVPYIASIDIARSRARTRTNGDFSNPLLIWAPVRSDLVDLIPREMNKQNSFSNKTIEALKGNSTDDRSWNTRLGANRLRGV